MQIINAIIAIRAFFAAKYNFRRWNSSEELKAWQDKMIAKHLAQVRPNSVFFHNRIPKDWRLTPVCSKRDLMDNFQIWNTRGISLEAALAVAIKAEESRDFRPKLCGLTVGLSSGTSGSKGIFLISERESSLWAGTVLARILRPKGTSRIALFMRAGSNLYSSTGKLGISFKFFDTMIPVADQLASLNNFKPTLLVAPPAILMQLANSSLAFLPHQVVSIADVLDPADRLFLNSKFGLVCDEIYQATEGFLAATCCAGNLHWNEDAVQVEKEWIDSSHYYPIITDFRRTTQPIIRYRLEDIIEHESSPCPCGSVFGRIRRVIGRADEILWLQDVTSYDLVPVLPDFIRRAVICALPNHSEYKVVQTAHSHLDVYLSDASAFYHVCNSILCMCGLLHVRHPSIALKPYEPQKPDEKRRRVIGLK